MDAERNIISWWLNKKGFFTINSVKVARNREIDFIAIKIEEGKVQKIIHVESSCSVSSMDTLKPSKYAERFTDKAVIKTVRDTIKFHVGKDFEYDRLLIIGVTSKLSEFKKLKETDGIDIREFRQIIFDVTEKLDRQNYSNNTIRTLQLVKFILLSGPQKLAELLHSKDEHKILKKDNKKEFIMSLLSDPETRKILETEGAEDLIIQILKHSSINRPERLAKILGEEIISPRARKKFVETLLSVEAMQKAKPKPKVMTKSDQSLSSFFN